MVNSMLRTTPQARRRSFSDWPLKKSNTPTDPHGYYYHYSYNYYYHYYSYY